MSYWTTGKGNWSESAWDQEGAEEIQITSELTAYVAKEFKIPHNLLFVPPKPWRIVMRTDGEPVFHSPEVRDQFLGKGQSMFDDLPVLMRAFTNLYKELLNPKWKVADGYTENGKRNLGSELRNVMLQSIEEITKVVRKVQFPITNESVTIGQVRKMLYTVNSEPLMGMPPGTVRIAACSVGSVELQVSLTGFTEHSLDLQKQADHNILFNPAVTVNDYDYGAKSNAIATKGETPIGYNSLISHLDSNIAWNTNVSDNKFVNGASVAVDPFSKRWDDTIEKVDETLKGRNASEASVRQDDTKKINFREFT